MKFVLTKSEARRQAKAARNSLSDSEVSAHSRCIFDKLTALREYRDSSRILAYADCNREVATADFIQICLNDGKHVALPRVTAAGCMDFYEIHDLSELIPGSFGIPEPVGNRMLLPEPDSSVLMLLPGLAFDHFCHRVGYGGGYYDRYLMDKSWIFTVAVCHEVQLMAEIITEEHDISPDLLITENRTLYKNTCI
ncbi:MAG: 5-formyltetrahydrofolate cyclo-ligase [Lachnospiraceae bacterium]|nr:5-formyltetrahydrofolate cyclo-ligase [Lachnospiraceae bacterium]